MDMDRRILYRIPSARGGRPPSRQASTCNRPRRTKPMPYNCEIPYGAYWSTPFAKWQGSFANLHSVEFAAHVAKAELAKRNIAPTSFDYAVLGMTVPQKASFYGLPWFMGLIGAREVGGPTINQACAT